MGNEENRYAPDDFCGFIFNKPQPVKENLQGWVDHFRKVDRMFVVLQQVPTGGYVIFKGGPDIRDIERSIPLSKVLDDGYRVVEYLDMVHVP